MDITSITFSFADGSTKVFVAQVDLPVTPDPVDPATEAAPSESVDSANPAEDAA